MISGSNIDLQERRLEYLKDSVSDFYIDIIDEQIDKVKSNIFYEPEI